MGRSSSSDSTSRGSRSSRKELKKSKRNKSDKRYRHSSRSPEARKKRTRSRSRDRNKYRKKSRSRSRERHENRKSHKSSRSSHSSHSRSSKRSRSKEYTSSSRSRRSSASTAGSSANDSTDYESSDESNSRNSHKIRKSKRDQGQSYENAAKNFATESMAKATEKVIINTHFNYLNCVKIYFSSQFFPRKLILFYVLILNIKESLIPDTNTDVVAKLRMDTAIREVESSSFEQKTFKSSRSQASSNQASRQENEELFQFGTSAEKSAAKNNGIGDKPITNILASVAGEGLCHPNLFGDPVKREERWIEYLLKLRESIHAEQTSNK